MTPEEFRQLLQQQTDSQLLTMCLRDDQSPYVFQRRSHAWDTFRDELVAALGVGRDDIRVVGSGRFGFSMRPQNNLRPFRDTSDIDLVVVNAGLFDQLWLALLDAAYPRPPTNTGGWLRARKNELYTGWLSPTANRLDRRIYGAKADAVLNISLQWFNALKNASAHPPRRHESIKGRLYRTWQHADRYHLYSLATLRESLR